jgi:hypothetical protein
LTETVYINNKEIVKINIHWPFGGWLAKLMSRKSDEWIIWVLWKDGCWWWWWWGWGGGGVTAVTEKGIELAEKIINIKFCIYGHWSW